MRYRILLALIACLPFWSHASNGDFTFTASGQSLELNMQGDLSAAFDISGSFTGGNFVFEVTVDGTSWRPVRAKRSNADTRETSTGVIAGNPGYYWTMPFGPVQKARIRCTQLTTGTAYAIMYGTVYDLSNLEVGPQGIQGAAGSQGIQGPAGVNAIGGGTAISPSFGAAFQATDNTKPALLTINVTSTATLSLTGGQTHSAQLVIAPTSGAACSAGTGSRIIGRYSNSNTGTLSVGLNLSTISLNQLQSGLPAGFWACLVNTAGTVTVVSAFDQPVG